MTIIFLKNYSNFFFHQNGHFCFANNLIAPNFDNDAKIRNEMIVKHYFASLSDPPN